MNEYAKHLMTLGATEEDAKVMATPLATKAWEQTQAALAKATTDKAEAEAAKQRTLDWYNNTAVPEFTTMQNKLTVAKAEEARARAALMAAQEQGLVDVAKDLGYQVEPPVKKDEPPNFDTSKFVTTDILMQVAEREGDAIAAAQDIAYEHSVLFPGQRLNFRELRKEAVARKVPVEQYWMDKYKVPDARAAKESAERAAYEKKLRDEGAAAVRAQYAERGNPDLMPAQPSRNPFAPRPDSDPRHGKQPWQAPSEDVLSNERVKRVLAKQGQVQ